MRVVPFNSEFTKDTFDCGEHALNQYLQQLAGQHTRKNISRTFCAITAAQQVTGFYSLSMAEAVLEELPASTRKKLPPHYPVPVARLSRLAVSHEFKGQRVGEMLLLNALSRCAKIANEIGTVGIVVDAKHETAQRFYQKYGFISYSTQPLTLFIPMQTVLQSLPV